MEYIFMSKNTPLLSCEIDNHTGFILRVNEIYSKDFLPVSMANLPDDKKRLQKYLYRWWSKRAIPASHIIDSIEYKSDTSLFEHFKKACDKLEIEDAVASVNEMLLLDFIIENTDRHLNNFGFIRNVETLEWKGFAPEELLVNKSELLDILQQSPHIDDSRKEQIVGAIGSNVHHIEDFIKNQQTTVTRNKLYKELLGETKSRSQES